LLSAAGYVFLQTVSPAPPLATLMPSGALLYLEAPDFSGLLRDWDGSKVKADWLVSANYDVFSRSLLFSKLHDVYGEYGEAAGFLPDLKSVIEIAGKESALALYGIRDVEFLYIGRVADADFVKSPLWAVRDKFEQRQAGGVSFYLRQDAASKRTVAFAFAKGYLLLATRDDLVAQSLELLAGGGKPSVASDRWYRDSVGIPQESPQEPARASNPAELRLVMNLESLVKSAYFRSYWVQRNASTLRRYWAGVVDVRRAGGNFTESRVFLRVPEAAGPAAGAPGSAAVSSLLALVPPEAGLYKAWLFDESSDAAAAIVEKLIAPQPQGSPDSRYAPSAVSLDLRAGSEGDLETRIDEQPLPSGPGISDSVAAVRAMIDKAGGRALLLVQSSSPAAGTFLQMPSVIVLEAGQDWDPGSVRISLTAAAGTLWTTSQLGAAWAGGTAGRYPVERMDGLASLIFANRGHLLFLSNDALLLTAVLDRAGAQPPTAAATYAAGFRHLRERPNYERVMAALDFTSPAGNADFGRPGGPGAPSFFSENLGSLSRVLSKLAEIRVTEEATGSLTRQTVVYQMGQ
jgi:hypothetical protein